MATRTTLGASATMVVAQGGGRRWLGGPGVSVSSLEVPSRTDLSGPITSDCDQTQSQDTLKHTITTKL